MHRNFSAIASLCCGLLVSLIAASGSLAHTSQVLPPNGVYTCQWITANPTAATLARVSCNSDMVNPGSLVSPASVASVRPDANGSQDIPSPTTCVSQGVYTRTTSEYAGVWTWYPILATQPYYYYLKKSSDDSNVYNGHSTGGGGGATEPNNVYYFKVQNDGPTCQRWHVTYDTV